MVLVDFDSFCAFSYDFAGFPMVFGRFRPVRGTGERASQPPQSTSQPESRKPSTSIRSWRPPATRLGGPLAETLTLSQDILNLRGPLRNPPRAGFEGDLSN